MSKNIGSEKKRDDRVKDISLIRVVNQEKISLETLKNIFKFLSEKYNLTSDDVLGIISDEKKFLSIPVTIFCKELSPLECVVRFIKEAYAQNFNEIAATLNRNQATIWLTYSHSLKKKKDVSKPEDTPYWIPLSLLRDRKLSILELVSEFLKDSYNLSYHVIGQLLKRDDRTIWTVYQRAKKKRQHEKIKNFL